MSVGGGDSQAFNRGLGGNGSTVRQAGGTIARGPGTPRTTRPVVSTESPFDPGNSQRRFQLCRKKIPLVRRVELQWASLSNASCGASLEGLGTERVHMKWPAVCACRSVLSVSHRDTVHFKQLSGPRAIALWTSHAGTKGTVREVTSVAPTKPAVAE